MSYTIILFMLLITAIKVQAECQKPFVGENRVFTADSAQQTFPDGATLKFKCSTGYIPVQSSMSRSITCNGTDWSELQLQCKKRSCGNPGEIVNGKYLYESTDGVLYGAVVTAECDEGYLMFGPQTRNCRENGWDSRAPVCEAVHCTKPLPIADGWFEPEEIAYDYGNSISFSCKRDYRLFGPSTLTCSANGTFQPDPPRCLLVTCDRPEIPYADRIEGKSPPYKYSQFVRYRCIEGYKMEGSDFLTCTEKGWDPDLPRCNVITCKNPPNLNNGTFDPIKEVYEYKEKVTYSCKEGYRISKASSISCTLDGTFEPLLSKCLVRTCNEPNVLDAFIDQGKALSYPYNSSIQMKCSTGYTMEGSGLLSCKQNGWIPQLPKCNIVNCSAPPVIDHSQFKPLQAVYTYNETVTYSCDQGFKLHGASTKWCTADGRFQDPPQCLAITCEKPNIINGYIIEGESTSYKYNSVVRFQCNSGYTMGGNDHMTCKESGWDPTPQCHSNFLFWFLLSVFGFLAVLCVIVGCCCCQKNKGIRKCFTPKERSNDICNYNQPVLVRVPISASQDEEFMLKNVN